MLCNEDYSLLHTLYLLYCIIVLHSLIYVCFIVYKF